MAAEHELPENLSIGFIQATDVSVNGDCSTSVGINIGASDQQAYEATLSIADQMMEGNGLKRREGMERSSKSFGFNSNNWGGSLWEPTGPKPNWLVGDPSRN